MRKLEVCINYTYSLPTMNVSFSENVKNVNNEGESGNQTNGRMTEPSVYHATGLFVDTEKQIHLLPPRNKGHTTPRLRWFLELSLSGIGEFIR